MLTKNSLFVSVISVFLGLFLLPGGGGGVSNDVSAIVANGANL